MQTITVTLAEVLDHSHPLSVLTAYHAGACARALAVQRGLDVTRPYVVVRDYLREGVIEFRQVAMTEAGD